MPFLGNIARLRLGSMSGRSLSSNQANYRHFIETGTFHTFLANDARTYDVGANGISVADWIQAMIKPGNRTWENLEAPLPF